MKVLILGASGIVGQHMRLCVPAGVDPVWVRQTEDPITRGVDLTRKDAAQRLLEDVRPDAVVNLAGAGNVDAIEVEPERYWAVNVGLPLELARLCHGKIRLIHVSSQAVYGGDAAPYGPRSPAGRPRNHYGCQKGDAEALVRGCGGEAIVVRLSFILGIRPLPHVGRSNPLEHMLEGQSPQVCDRYFSPLLAWDAARLLWDAALHAEPDDVWQCGIPETWTRYGIAKLVNPEVQPCSHLDFPGIAERPIDTTYRDSRYRTPVEATFLKSMPLHARDLDREIELSLFLGMPLWDVINKLAKGFGRFHAAVADDWRRADPHTEEQILDWYRTTESYIWELSAYHDDPVFNYAGLCQGIAEGLNAHGANRVLCLGDGIGDLTLSLRRAKLEAFYHDLPGARTAKYAAFRYWRKTGERMPIMLPDRPGYPPLYDVGEWDAVCALDFLEHLADVGLWVRAIHQALKPGGVAFFQNAFACGSGPDGSIPMHLSCNDRYEKDFDPLMAEVGFEQISSNWYRKP